MVEEWRGGDLVGVVGFSMCVVAGSYTVDGVHLRKKWCHFRKMEVVFGWVLCCAAW